jgi:hypothetical protein
LLIGAWLFGDKYLMPSLQNKAMSVLIEKIGLTSFVPTACLELVYDSTLPGSALRKFLVDTSAYECDPIEVVDDDKVNFWPREALVDLLRVVGAKKKEEIGDFSLPKANNGKCYYHVHADGEDCDTKL